MNQTYFTLVHTDVGFTLSHPDIYYWMGFTKPFLVQKKTQTGEERRRFEEKQLFEKTLNARIFWFVITLPFSSGQNSLKPPVNHTKLSNTNWKFQGQKPLTGHRC